MALSLRPDEFRVGLEHTRKRPATEDVWELFGERYRVNPRHLVGDADLGMVRIWRLCRPRPGKFVSAMGAAWLPSPPGPLPERGGLLDQAAVMIDALDVMDAAAAELEAEAAREP